jgi:UDP-N-acetyl-D-glucosamine dehydrogenase
MSSPDGKPTKRVGVVGLGYVGLPLAVAFAEAGHEVVGIDTDARRVAGIAAGESHIEDISSERLQAVVERIAATTDYGRLADCDAVLIAVPTPLTVNREPDLGPLLSSARALARVVREGQLVVLE